MLNFSWSELLLIAVVAIVVIGPKELPEALRSLGRGLTKLRRMAGEFQGQFNEALREANLEDVKKEFDALRQSTSVLKGGFNPVDIARNEIRGAITGPAMTPASPAPMIDTALTSSAAVTAPAAPPPEPPATTLAEPEPIPSAFVPYPAFRRAAP